VAARATAVLLLAAAALPALRRGVPRSVAGPAAMAGLIDAVANILALLALQQGLLSLVAAITSLYPASTLLLARLVLREKLRRVQVFGLVVAAVAVILMTG
jgi:uncharacterized membrane protein